MKEVIIVQLSFKRCRGELQVDKGREERHAGREACVKAGSCDRVCLFQGDGETIGIIFSYFVKSSGDRRLLFY